eukprot:459589_1
MYLFLYSICIAFKMICMMGIIYQDHITSDNANFYLYAGDQIYSSDNSTMLTFQGDGHFVLYNDITAIWASGVWGFTPGYVAMQTDGNLVVYDSGNAAKWSSGTLDLYAPFHLVVDNQCAYILNTNMDNLWNTETSGCTNTMPPTTSPTLKPTTCNDSPYLCLATPQSLVAWYDGGSMDALTKRWMDKSGNGYHGYFFNGTGRVLTETNQTNELYLNNQPVVYGNPADRIEFGYASRNFMDPSHTIFNLCKYREYGLKITILQNTEYLGRYGHYLKAGNAYDVRPLQVYNDLGNNWLLSTTTPNFYRANGVDSTYPDWRNQHYLEVETYGKTKLGINVLDLHYPGSDWACSEIIVVNEILDTTQIECIEHEYFNCKYDLKLTLSPTLNPTNPTPLPTTHDPTILTTNPTLSPSGNPTLTTLSPTSSPTLPGDSSPIQCGTSTWCDDGGTCYDYTTYCHHYWRDIYPLLGTETSNTVHITSNIDTYLDKFYVKFTSIGQDCYFPAISFEYEMLNIENHGGEYVDLFNNDSVSIQRCLGNGGADFQCDVFWECLSYHPLGIDRIENGSSYTVEIIKQWARPYFCAHGRSTTANLTLICRTTAAPTSDQTPSPTSNPTLSTSNPTRSSPTTSPTPTPLSNRTSCNGRWCYFIDLYPLIGTETSTEMDIENIEYDEFFEIYLNVHGYHCVDPTINLELQYNYYRYQFLFSGTNYARYDLLFRVFDDDDLLIQQCGPEYVFAVDQCNTWISCINDYNVGTIRDGKPYKITVFATTHAQNQCNHQWPILAKINISCSGKTAQPTTSPTSSPSDIPTTPTTLPTNAPTEITENPTFSPSQPTISPTSAPSLPPTSNPSISPTFRFIRARTKRIIGVDSYVFHSDNIIPLSDRDNGNIKYSNYYLPNKIESNGNIKLGQNRAYCVSCVLAWSDIDASVELNNCDDYNTSNSDPTDPNSFYHCDNGTWLLKSSGRLADWQDTYLRVEIWEVDDNGLKWLQYKQEFNWMNQTCFILDDNDEEIQCDYLPLTGSNEYAAYFEFT